MMSCKNNRTISINALLAVTSIMVSYVVIDALHRVFSYNLLKNSLTKIYEAEISVDLSKSNQRSGLYLADPDTGYRYPANFDGVRGHPWNNKFHMNSHGHVTNREYSIEKPANEFRIAVIGDSFTANINNSVRWTEVAEDKLNSTPEWIAKVGGRYTRLINFAIDGAGFQMFAAIAKYKAQTFQPDALIVSFISDDILRKFNRPLGLQAKPGTPTAETVTNAVNAALDSINWLSLKPELAIGILDFLLPSKYSISPQIPLNFTGQLYLENEQRFSDTGKAIHASAQAIESMNALFPNRILYFRNPLRHQLAGAPTQWDGLEERVAKATPSWTYVDLKPRFLKDYTHIRPERFRKARLDEKEILKLPPEERPDEFNWFFYPYDDHYSDKGTTMQGLYVAEYLIENWTPPRPTD